MSLLNTVAEFDPIRVGLVGVGNHARLIVLPALSLILEIQLAAACVAHQETADAATARYRVPTYIGFERMLEAHADELDGVLVVGGPQTKAILACLEAGLHVWSETPAIRSRDDARGVRDAALATDKIVEVGSCLRHAPIYVRMRQMLHEWRRESEGPRLFQVSYYPYEGHFYNLLQFFNGDVREVAAVKGETETLVHLRFQNDDLGTLTARHFNNNSVSFEEVSISAPDGMLVARNGWELRHYRAGETKHPMELCFDLADATLMSPTHSLPYGEMNQLYLRGYVPELQYFARMVRLGASPVCTVDDMERSTLVEEAVNRAAASRSWETVET